jgi:dUTP pyrophosphatase
MKQIPVNVMKLHPDAAVPAYARPGDAGFDLVAVEDTIIQPGETKLVRTGLAVALPTGYELQVRPRSGISLKTKLRVSNAPGTVDSGYRGEICVLIDNIATPQYSLEEGQLQIVRTREVTTLQNQREAIDTACASGSYLIRKGDRIAQGVIAEVPQASFELVQELDETVRGAGGFGSSGTN